MVMQAFLTQVITGKSRSLLALPTQTLGVGRSQSLPLSHFLAAGLWSWVSAGGRYAAEATIALVRNQAFSFGRHGHSITVVH